MGRLTPIQLNVRPLPLPNVPGRGKTWRSQAGDASAQTATAPRRPQPGSRAQRTHTSPCAERRLTSSTRRCTVQSRATSITTSDASGWV
jgi:hypothetical protein